MAIRIIPAKRVKKAKTKNSEEILHRLEQYLKDSCNEPVEILCGFWKDQQDAITYQELREAIRDGAISQETLRLWSQDYSVLVANKLNSLWMDGIQAGMAGQPALDGLVFSMQTPGIWTWIGQRGAEFVTNSTQEQKNAIAALLAKKMRDGHTVDELSRLIRPCIGLTERDAKAAVRFYDNIVETLKKDHPRMKPESIRRKALDATQKYAERKHRRRAMTIAQTESAFAYNRGADEGVRQAQAAGYLGMMKKRWCTSGDDAVCETCASLEGLEIDMEAEFSFKGRVLFQGHKMLPPAHPRCACAVEYIEAGPPNEMLEIPMRVGDEWIDHSIEDYNRNLIDTNGDETMNIRLLLSNEEVRYERDDSLKMAFAYDTSRDMILYNSNAANANDYDMRFVLTHENAHRIDYLYLHSWENQNFISAINSTESLIMSNLEAVENLLQNESYGLNFAFNDLLSSLTKGAINDMLFIGHDPEYLSVEHVRIMEIFANITCIDMNGDIIRKEFEGLLKDLYEAYKEVVSWRA